MTPSNLVAMYVVRFLQLMFIAWAAYLCVSSIRAYRELQTNLKLSNIDDLMRFRKDFTFDEGHPVHREKFTLFLKDHNVPKTSHIAKHVNTIFECGITGSQMDVNSLLNHTHYKLFGVNTLLKNILSIFIIVGLLGTLFGLADSLARLSPMLGASDIGQIKGGIAVALKSLLGDLKNAFAPSIWGVVFTVLGVLMYAAHVNFFCSPLRIALETTTINTWLPKLYPTTTQELYRTLQKSEEHMRQNFQAAKKVAELAEVIQDDTGKLKQNLERANRLLGPLSTTAQQMSNAAEFFNDVFCKRMETFSADFIKSVSFLTTFQEEIRLLYDQIVSGSETFKKNLSESLSVQQQEIHDIVLVLKTYETSFLQLRENIDRHLLKFISEATESATSISTSNREMSRQQSENLTKSLKEIRDTLSAELKDIFTRLENFDAPVKKAADKLEGSFESFYRQMEAIVVQMQEEIVKQNAVYGRQVAENKDLRERIEVLFKHMDSNGAKQTESILGLFKHSDTLHSVVGGLSHNIAAFTKDASMVAQAAQEIERHIKALKDEPSALSSSSRKLDLVIKAFGDLSKVMNNLDLSLGDLKALNEKMFASHQADVESSAMVAHIPKMTNSLDVLSKNLETLITGASIESIRQTSTSTGNVAGNLNVGDILKELFKKK